jgi:hypothetical protein
MTQKDANGYRLSPEGKEVKLFIEYSPTAATFGTAKAVELFAEHLKAVGLNAEPRATETALLAQRGADHEIQIYAWTTFTPTDANGTETCRPNQYQWCPEWNWFEASGTPKPADMPTEFVDYIQAIEDRVQYVPRSPEDTALYEKIKAFYRDNYWVLVNLTNIPTPRTASTRLGNLVRNGPGLPPSTSSGWWRALEIAYFKTP